MNRMWRRRYLLFFTLLAALFDRSNGQNCDIEGIQNWLIPVTPSIYDTFRGSIFNGATTNIEAINSVSHSEALNSNQPYVTVSHTNSLFDVSTNALFENYEENETIQSMSFTVTFGCSDGNVRALVFIVGIIDTNNNDPVFRPSDEYEFTIALPVPPGFQVTGCDNDIVVRDIDLTTQRIDFTIEDNEYFEISYDGRSSSDPKEFRASIRTTTLIRNLPETVSLRISATDVDLTSDPPRTTYATVRIQGDSGFELPAEPVFAQPFYLATYTETSQVVLQGTISLQQGFDEDVEFTLEGDYLANFGLIVNGNQMSISVTTPLPNEVVRQGRIILVVRATREYTSGATTTVIVQMPEVPGLEFEQPTYQGLIVDNVLQLSQLVLTQGFADGITISFDSDHSSFFSATVQGNIVTITMTPLQADIINNNTFINLQVIASNDYSTTSTIVTLEIIKDDNETPVFENDLYTGTYDTETGLSIEQILIVQGYDDTVVLSFEGEHSEYFQLIESGHMLNLTSPGIPVNIFAEQQILLTILASKPRTVGASTVASIALPPARQMGFAETSYSGTIRDNNLVVGTIELSYGYAEGVQFTLDGDHATSFTATNVQNQVTINLPAPLPDNVILDNNFLMLTLVASGQHAVTASTTVLLEIIKQDVTTPVFEQNIYYGSHGTNVVDISNMSLVQGYDDTVSFRLGGEHSNYFGISYAGNNVAITVVSAIPEEIIFNEKVLTFNILADKPLTVGANAAISISFPRELTEPVKMRFSKNTYIGAIENDTLTSENIILESGFTAETNFSLVGDLREYFTFTRTNEVITISLTNEVTNATFIDTNIVILELVAERDRAVTTSASIVIDIIQIRVIDPIFSNAYYRGVYTVAEGLQFGEQTALSQGYDETVTFSLQGEFSTWFLLNVNENMIILEVNGTIPEDVLLNHNQFLFSVVADKPDAIDGRAAISIELPKEIQDPVVLRFTQPSYVGRIDIDELTAPVISLEGETPEPLLLNVTGEYASYFELQRELNDVTLLLRTQLPVEVLEGSVFITIGIEASYPEAITGYATVVLEIIREPQIVTPVFEQTYYTGEYSEQDGLVFDSSIQLIQGFDGSVAFTLEGDDGRWFELVNRGDNNLTLNVIEGVLLQVEDRSHLMFSVIAAKFGSANGSAAVVISLSDFSTSRLIQFSQNYYTGSIENNNLTIDTMYLVEGYSEDLDITLSGDYMEYFQLSNQEGNFTLQLISALTEDILSNNDVIILSLEVQINNSGAHTTIIIELVKDVIITPVFNEAYYTGSYSEIDGLTFDPQITLTDGYDDTVVFSLEGEHAQWFDVVQEENSATLILNGTITPEILENNQPFIFVIVAQKVGTAAVRATVVITVIDETTVLAFGSNSYLGSIDYNITTIGPIILSEGYTENINVSFTLNGDLERYFSVGAEGPNVTISVLSAIPDEEIPESQIIVLELQASALRAVPAFATLVFNVRVEEVIQPLFAETYYTGQYSEDDGLTFEETITLSEGYDENIEFTLEGDSSDWFQPIVLDNSVTLEIVTPIPPEVIINHQQIIFVIRADKQGSRPARATVVIDLLQELANLTVLGFERINYLGSIENNTINHPTITLTEGYSNNVTFTLLGELSSFFNLTQEGPNVNISLQSTITEDLIPENRVIIIEVHAAAQHSITAHTTLVLEWIEDTIEAPIFSETYYRGLYSESRGLVFDDVILLSSGHDSTVQFSLEGDGTEWFGIETTGNAVSLTLLEPVPPEVITNNQQVVLIVEAQKVGAETARATIIISLIDDNAITTVLEFERNYYLGSYENNTINIETITLTEGYSNNVNFTLTGELSNYFTLTTEESAVTIVLQTPITDANILASGLILLELHATAPQAAPIFTTLVFTVVLEDTIELAFSETYYTGVYSEEGLIIDDYITIVEGYNQNVDFLLEGDGTQWFGINRIENTVSLVVNTPVPNEVLIARQNIILVVSAEKPENIVARATIVIALQHGDDDMVVLTFERNNYIGFIENDISNLQPITLSQGYSDSVTFNLLGDLVEYFTSTSEGPTVTVALETPIPENSIPNNRIVIIEVQASALQTISAFTTIVFEYRQANNISLSHLAFSETYYEGQYSEQSGLIFDETITLAEGYDENVEFNLDGDSSDWFDIIVSGNSVTLIVETSLPEDVIINNQLLVFVIYAQKPGSAPARAAIIIYLNSDSDSPNESSVRFEKVLFEGVIQAGAVSHESITVSGYDGEVVDLLGEYSELFVGSVSDGVVTVRGAGAVELSTDVTVVPLELRIDTSGAVLLLNVLHSDSPALPTVIFSSPSYAVRVEVGQTGLIGRVSAAADNGEAVTYSLVVDDGHLLQRLSIDSEGDIHLSAPANSGVYTFQVAATTAFTQVTGNAPVYLTVDAITICGEDGNLVVPPLIILDRDEEQPLSNLVVLDGTEFEGCRYTLTNRWPLDQTWLYVDETGLHATAIDREHASIAFMALSQVQVELILECDSDAATRTKRSLDGSSRLDWLGPYDYGNNKWILTDTIQYNSRRSLVNLIVNDINDNYPIFVGKEDEPIAVGYPVPELEERLLPRALVELQATDADVGENAALLYWSSDTVLAVSPSSGSVHVRQNTLLEDDMLTVYATDQNGEGLTGSIDLVVKLLTTDNIAVVTVRYAFLDDEQSILETLSSAIGYEVKVLRSVVIPDNTEAEVLNPRNQRNKTTYRASLQLYVYGLIEREPVEVDRLTEDITNSVIPSVSIASSVSLEDHLDGLEICDVPGRDTGLLVATIVLSVLLFILIVVAGVWFFLTWRKKKSYEQFSDANSLASRNESPAPRPKEENTKPRLNIEELKRSERRLQEMLEAPVDTVVKTEPSTSRKETIPESKINITPVDPPTPLVIQSIDKLKDVEESEDDDEYGERARAKRKSVVTFNENVEKIIHVEDTPDDDDFEVYRL